jgi:hypothetical protein
MWARERQSRFPWRRHRRLGSDSQTWLPLPRTVTLAQSRPITLPGEIQLALWRQRLLPAHFESFDRENCLPVSCLRDADCMCSEDVCRILFVERPIMDVLNRAIANVHRFHCHLGQFSCGGVHASSLLRVRNPDTKPKLYELMGKPAYISRYSWAFLRKASKHPEFQELTVRARTALRVASVLDVVLTTLTILLVILALRALFGH